MAGRPAVWATAWWPGPAAEAARGAGHGHRTVATRAAAGRLALVLWWTWCPRIGGVSTVRATTMCLMSSSGEGSPEQRLDVRGRSGGGAAMSHSGEGAPVMGGASGGVCSTGGEGRR
jgi:hypothetical protein